MLKIQVQIINAYLAWSNGGEYSPLEDAIDRAVDLLEQIGWPAREIQPLVTRWILAADDQAQAARLGFEERRAS